MNKDNALTESIIANMSEGIMTLSMKGKIVSLNPAGEKILDVAADEVVGKAFAGVFFSDERNDAFNQLVLDAIADPDTVKDAFVPYAHDDVIRQIRLLTSLQVVEGEKIGIIIVISDMTELFELRDAMKAMERIRALNGKLEERNEILQRTFGRFLSDEIVHELLETPDGLMMGGKKECLTIMMSDLRGFTALSERLNPADLLTMLNHYLGEMTRIIQDHRGTIIEFIGDGIMAIFGAPQYFEENAAEAVAAAVEMQREMEKINAWNEENGFPYLKMGIGLNCGDVIVGLIGSEQRTKYGVAGKEVNLAGRIESFTTAGELLISETVREAVGTDLKIAETRQVVPKGAKKPMNVYRVVGIGAPYYVECKEEVITRKTLSVPCKVVFRTLSEKNVSVTSIEGTFLELGEGGAILKTEERLARFDNILIEFGGDLYGKVTHDLGTTYEITFTSLPTGFADAMQKALSAT
ncbi:MAG: PAS domain S-box protein [Lachnospiraceae bacterium]|nr:PAS domain S-box protein [Lachnospiraceae bacterium]